MDNAKADPSSSHLRTVAVRRARKDRDMSALTAALSDPMVAALAAKYLGEISAKEAVPELLRLLESDDPHARANAAQALGTLGELSATERLAETARNDAAPWMRSWAIGAYGRVAGPRGVPALFAALEDPDWRVRRAAVQRLGIVADRSILPQLALRKKREPWYHRRTYHKVARAVRRRTQEQSS